MSGPPPLSVWAVWAGHFCLHLPFSLLVSLCEDGMNLLKLNFFKIPIVLYSAVLFFFFWAKFCRSYSVLQNSFNSEYSIYVVVLLRITICFTYSLGLLGELESLLLFTGKETSAGNKWSSHRKDLCS